MVDEEAVEEHLEVHLEEAVAEVLEVVPRSSSYLTNTMEFSSPVERKIC